MKRKIMFPWPMFTSHLRLVLPKEAEPRLIKANIAVLKSCPCQSFSSFSRAARCIKNRPPKHTWQHSALPQKLLRANALETELVAHCTHRSMKFTRFAPMASRVSTSRCSTTMSRPSSGAWCRNTSSNICAGLLKRCRPSSASTCAMPFYWCRCRLAS